MNNIVNFILSFFPLFAEMKRISTETPAHRVVVSVVLILLTLLIEGPWLFTTAIFCCCEEFVKRICICGGQDIGLYNKIKYYGVLAISNIATVYVFSKNVHFWWLFSNLLLWSGLVTFGFYLMVEIPMIRTKIKYVLPLGIAFRFLAVLVGSFLILR